MKKFFLSVVRDRHVDPEFKLFGDADKAIAYTQQRFYEISRYPDDICQEFKKEDENEYYVSLWYYEYEIDEAYVTYVELID